MKLRPDRPFSAPAMLSAVALAAACRPAERAAPSGDAGDSGAASGEGLYWTRPGAEVPGRFIPASACAAPVAGIGRLTERGAALGLRTAARTAASPASCPVVPGVVVAADLDGDGGDELIFNHPDEAPLLVVVEGGALVERRLDALAPPEGRALLGLAAADLDGDGHADLIGLGEGFLVVAPNDGRMGFAGWEPHFWQDAHPRDCLTGIGLGDIDGDGDLDASLPGLDRVPWSGAVMGAEASGWRGSEDRLLRNDGGRLVLDRSLPRGRPGTSLSLVHLISDRDNDGDQDILAFADRANGVHPPAAAWRNDGPDAGGRPVLIDEAAAIGQASMASAMGLVAADLNDDGRIDTCVSDTTYKLDCRLSGEGGYHEGALMLGLRAADEEVDHAQHPEGASDAADRGPSGAPSMAEWTAWGLAYVDLENDGHSDIATVAGPPPDLGSVHLSGVHGWQPDWLWQGAADGTFRTAVVETGFHRLDWGYGLVAVDLFGDGHPELVVGRAEGPPEVWDNPCGAGAWLRVSLEGPPGNPRGIGAQVSVRAGGRRQLQQVVAQSGTQQHSLSLHFGLGAAEQVDAIHVRWPDGRHTHVEAVPVRGELWLQHPGG